MDQIHSYFDLASIMICLSVTTIVYGVYSYRRTYSFWSSRGIKGPIPLPFFGNSLTYILNSVPEVDYVYRKRYGKLYGIYDGSNPVLIVSDPEIIERIFIIDYNSFKNHINIIPENPLIGNQIFFKRGNDLKKIRSLFTQGMTQSKLKGYLDMIRTDDMIEYLRMKKFDAKSTNEINVSNLMTLHLLNVSTRIFYGVDLDLFHHQDHYLVGIARNFFAFLNVVPAFISNHLAILSNIFPNPSNVVNDYVCKLVKLAINERIKYLESKRDSKACKNDVETPNDFLQQMIESNITEDERLANCVLMVGVAFDTTAMTTTFMLYELAKNKNVLHRLRQEIDQIVDADAKITFEHLSKMTFLENCFTETLRVHPTDIRVSRQASEHTTIPTTNIRIPPSTYIQVPTYALHHDSEIFDHPNEFNPDRWSEEGKKSIKNCSFMSFGAGPRKCPGGQFALMNSKLAVVEIVRRYDLEVSPRTDTKIPAGVMMPDPTKVWIRFSPRE